MGMFLRNLKPVVAAAVFWLASILAAAADSPVLDDLFARLKTADPVGAAQIVREIEMEWRQSGSPSMDLLLKRGQEALETGKPALAIEHFSALIDHAPEFAEGWHGRATAWFELNQYGLALADLEHALTLNPRQFEAIYGLGVIMEQLERREQAYDAFGIVLGLNPNHERAAEAIRRLDRGVNGIEL